VAIFGDLEVIVASKTINAFSEYMNSQSFSSSFDHAVGLFRWLRMLYFLIQLLKKSFYYPIILLFSISMMSINRKDLWSDNTNDEPTKRSYTAGFSHIGGVCSSKEKYSVVESEGGFAEILVSYKL
jgi:hypothetical protein